MGRHIVLPEGSGGEAAAHSGDPHMILRVRGKQIPVNDRVWMRSTRISVYILEREQRLLHVLYDRIGGAWTGDFGGEDGRKSRGDV